MKEMLQENVNIFKINNHSLSGFGVVGVVELGVS